MSDKFTNLLPRVLVAVVAAPLILYICYIGGIWFMLFALAVGILSLVEFMGLARAKGAQPQTAVAVMALVFLFISFFHEQIQNFIVPYFLDRGGISLLQKLQLFITVFFLFLAGTLAVELFRNKGSIFMNVGATIFGVSYVGIFLASLVGIRELFGAEFPYLLAVEHFPDASPLSDDALHAVTYAWGGWTIIAIIVSIWICDTAAYFGGLSMGKHKLFPRVSPKKSWEGAVWGFAGAVATMVLFQQYTLPYLSLTQAVTMGTMIGLFGQIGDLIESLLKRDAGVKDSSDLLPGHGGVLDRFDSLIYLSPILYLYIDFIILS